MLINWVSKKNRRFLNKYLFRNPVFGVVIKVLRVLLQSSN